MPALTFPNPGTPYTITPWTDPNGNEWLYTTAKDRWKPVGSSGGASTYAELSDAATVDLPATNTPLSAALGLKAPLANPSFTGTLNAATGDFSGNVDIEGNLLTVGSITSTAGFSGPGSGLTGTSAMNITGIATTATLAAGLPFSATGSSGGTTNIVTVGN